MLIGTGRSAATFLCELQKNPLTGRVTIIGSSHADLFFFRSLCALMEVNLEINLVDPDQIPADYGIYFTTLDIQQVDFEHKTIIYPSGTLGYDALVLVNEKRPKVLDHENQKKRRKIKSGQAHDCKNEGGTNAAVVEGSGFSALALVVSLALEGFQTYLVCNLKNFTDALLPEEEACLLAKHLKNKSIDILFEQKIERYLLDDLGNVSGVELSEGRTIACQQVVHAEGQFPDFSFLKTTPFYSGETFDVDRFSRIPALEDVFVFGQDSCNEKQGERSSGELNNETARYPGKDIFFQFPAGTAKPMVRSVHYNLLGMSWTVYGDLCTKWGKHTQNFYWEHPNGQISFRLLYDQRDFSIQCMASLGIKFTEHFRRQFVTGQWKAEELIQNLERGIVNQEALPEIFSLISKAFTVESKKVIKENNPSIFERIMERLF